MPSYSHPTKPLSARTHTGLARAWWPESVYPVEHPSHSLSLTKWLLEQLPPQIRSHRAIHAHLPVLLFLTRRYVAGGLSGVRESYRECRAEMSDLIPPETVAVSLRVIEDVGVTVRSHLSFIDVMCEYHGIDN